MKISFSPNLNHVQLNQSKKLNQNTVAQMQAQQSENINYPKISQAQYMAMKGVTFGQSDNKNFASLLKNFIA